MTKTDKLAKGLKATGYHEVHSNNRYRKFVKDDTILWLGSSAALRVGRSASDSRSLTGTRVYNDILKAGE